MIVVLLAHNKEMRWEYSEQSMINLNKDDIDEDDLRGGTEVLNSYEKDLIGFKVNLEDLG